MNLDKNKIAEMRLRYTQGSLTRKDLEMDPINQFTKWFNEAKESGIIEPNAMSLSTISPDKLPSSRNVLLKGIEDDKFQFFTNYDSRKSQEIESNNGKVSLLFSWLALERQIHIQGIASRISKHDSQSYFESRPRESQIGAVASNQSQPVESRDALEKAFSETEQKFDGVPVEMPKNWGGVSVRPITMEFWQGRPGRLHDRFEYRKTDDLKWEIVRLFP